MMHDSSWMEFETRERSKCACCSEIRLNPICFLSFSLLFSSLPLESKIALCPVSLACCTVAFTFAFDSIELLFFFSCETGGSALCTSRILHILLLSFSFLVLSLLSFLVQFSCPCAHLNKHIHILLCFACASEIPFYLTGCRFTRFVCPVNAHSSAPGRQGWRNFHATSSSSPQLTWEVISRCKRRTRVFSVQFVRDTSVSGRINWPHAPDETLVTEWTLHASCSLLSATQLMGRSVTQSSCICTHTSCVYFSPRRKEKQAELLTLSQVRFVPHTGEKWNIWWRRVLSERGSKIPLWFVKRKWAPFCRYPSERVL